MNREPEPRTMLEMVADVMRQIQPVPSPKPPLSEADRDRLRQQLIDAHAPLVAIRLPDGRCARCIFYGCLCGTDVFEHWFANNQSEN